MGAEPGEWSGQSAFRLQAAIKARQLLQRELQCGRELPGPTSVNGTRTCDSTMMTAAPLVKPDMVGWDMNLRRARPARARSVEPCLGQRGQAGCCSAPPLDEQREPQPAAHLVRMTPRPSRPDRVYKQATRKASWMTIELYLYCATGGAVQAAVGTRDDHQQGANSLWGSGPNGRYNVPPATTHLQRLELWRAWVVRAGYGNRLCAQRGATAAGHQWPWCWPAFGRGPVS